MAMDAWDGTVMSQYQAGRLGSCSFIGGSVDGGGSTRAVQGRWIDGSSMESSVHACPGFRSTCLYYAKSTGNRIWAGGGVVPCACICMHACRSIKATQAGRGSAADRCRSRTILGRSVAGSPWPHLYYYTRSCRDRIGSIVTAFRRVGRRRRARGPAVGMQP